MPVPTVLTVPQPTKWGYHARIGDYVLRLVTGRQEPYLIRRGVQQRDTVNTQVNPEDFTDDFGRTYSMVEFTTGENRRFAHRRNNLTEVQDQFWRSYGLEINAEGDLVVVNQMEQITASGAAFDIHAAYDGTAIYHTTNTADLTKITDLRAASPTTATEVTGLTNTAVDVTVVGTTVYACDGAEIRDNDGGWANWSALAATRIWGVKDRLIASDGRNLYEEPNGAGPFAGSELVIAPVGESFIDVVDAGSHILAATQSTIYILGFNGTTLELTTQREFPFEEIKAIGSLQGAVLVLTVQQEDDGDFTQRLWLGSVGADGGLVVGVYREWEGLATGDTSACLAEVERDSLFFAVDDGTDTSLWKYNIGFGYLMSDKIMDGLTGKAVREILKVEGFFWVFEDGGGVWRETSTKRASGTMISPAADFFSAEDKVWSEIITYGIFPSGDSKIVTSVSGDLDSMDAPFDETLWRRTQSVTASESSGARITATESRYLIARFVLEGEARLSSFSLKALPPPSEDEVVLLVNISDHISRPGKAPSLARGLGEEIWRNLRDLQGRSVILELFDLDRRWRGSIVEIDTPIESTLNTNSVTRVLRVVFRGTVTASTTTLTDMTWGTLLWGEGLWGGEDTEA